MISEKTARESKSTKRFGQLDSKSKIRKVYFLSILFCVAERFHVTFSKPLNTEICDRVLKLKCCFRHLTFRQFP